MVFLRFLWNTCQAYEIFKGGLSKRAYPHGGVESRHLQHGFLRGGTRMLEVELTETKQRFLSRYPLGPFPPLSNVKI